MIVTNKQKLLKPCAEASLFEASKIILSLEKELSQNTNGIGLAANQIGINLSVAVIRYKDQHIDLVNPKIIEQYDFMEFHYDGCLSFPGVQLCTSRPNEIVVKDDLHPNGFVSFGMEAVVVSHEIDHLLGITMFDRQIEIPQRNEKCWCGSGKKYKVCHLGKNIIVD